MATTATDNASLHGSLTRFETVHEVREANRRALSRVEIETIGDGRPDVPVGTEPLWHQLATRNTLALRKLASSNGSQIEWETTVGHIDTGVTRHPALGFTAGNDSDWVLLDSGYNYLERSQPPLDPADYGSGLLTQPGHGTRTLGVLASWWPGNYVGVAPRIPTIPYRVTNSVVLATAAQIANVADAINRCVSRGCRVISISLGSPFGWTDAFPMLQRAVDAAYQSGVIVVCAGGQKTDIVVYPAKFSRTIGAGGLTLHENGGGASSKPARIYKAYQEYGIWNDRIAAWAPATPIWRPDVMREEGRLLYTVTGGEDTAGWGDGTSFSTPQVAAAAAIWLTHGADAIRAAYGNHPWMIVEAFRRLLDETRQEIDFLPFGEVEPEKRTRLLDVFALLEAELPDPGTLAPATPAVDEIW